MRVLMTTSNGHDEHPLNRKIVTPTRAGRPSPSPRVDRPPSSFNQDRMKPRSSPADLPSCSNPANWARQSTVMLPTFAASPLGSTMPKRTSPPVPFGTRASPGLKGGPSRPWRRHGLVLEARHTFSHIRQSHPRTGARSCTSAERSGRKQCSRSVTRRQHRPIR